MGKCEKCGDWAGWIGVCVNLALVVMKVCVGLASGSKSCLADGLHSFANIITAMVIILSRKLSSKEKDEAFPFGYGKVEFIAAGFISLFIIGAAVSLITVSISHLLSTPASPPHISAVLSALISIVANEIIFRYMRCVGTNLKSQTILANAWANRADCFSSIVVVISVVGAYLGFHQFDPICAILVVVVIVKVSIDILVESIKALMDSSVNALYGDEIVEVVEALEGVQGISDLRTRQIGKKIWAELNIIIDSKCTMREGQAIADRVSKSLLTQVRDLEKVLVYFQPARS